MLIFNFFVGNWQTKRNIKSQDDSIIVCGIATFKPIEPNLLLYSEELVMPYGLGRQKYQYRYDPKSDSISKYFDDDRLFYTLEIQDNKAKGNHICGKDEYIADYTFDDNSFTLIYDINGPFKNHKIISTYSRVPVS